MNLFWGSRETVTNPFLRVGGSGGTVTNCLDRLVLVKSGPWQVTGGTVRKHLDEPRVKGPGVERPCEELLKLGEQGLQVRKHLDLSGRHGSGGPARTRSFRAWSDCHKQCGRDPPVYWGSSRSRSGSSSFTGRKKRIGSVANRLAALPTRLETRTKESNMCASQWALRNLKAQ